MLAFDRETLFLTFEETEAMLESHKAECVFEPERLPTGVRWDAYRALEELGKLHVYSARHAGILAGYCWMVVDNHMHFSSVTTAHCEMLYLAPAHRRGKAGIDFIRFVEGCLADDGVVKVAWSVKPQRDFSRVMRRLGYGVEEVVMSKFLN
jgi:GNAT superfamily N-acetyltransferase